MFSIISLHYTNMNKRDSIKCLVFCFTEGKDGLLVTLTLDTIKIVRRKRLRAIEKMTSPFAYDIADVVKCTIKIHSLDHR